MSSNIQSISEPNTTAASEQIPRSSTSIDSLSSGRHSPTIHEYDSTSALILVPEHEDFDHDESPEDPNGFFEVFSSDDDIHDDELDHFDLDSPTTRASYTTTPTLSSITIFLYLLSPLLKLGAFLCSSLGYEEVPLRICIPALLFFASLCALTRQIWYMLARYVKRTEIEEILLQTFVSLKLGILLNAETWELWITRRERKLPAKNEKQRINYSILEPLGYTHTSISRRDWTEMKFSEVSSSKSS